MGSSSIHVPTYAAWLSSGAATIIKIWMPVSVADGNGRCIRSRAPRVLFPDRCWDCAFWMEWKERKTLLSRIGAGTTLSAPMPLPYVAADVPDGYLPTYLLLLHPSIL